MKPEGYIALARGYFEHEIFAPEPFTEREAFQWMIMEAAYADRRVRRGHSLIDLKRGELAHSLRFMAKAWKWSEPRVRRFLVKLKTDAMVIVKSTHDTTHVTICNYDKYQTPRRTDVSASDAETDARATHARRKLEPLNHLTKDSTPPAAAILEELGKVLDRDHAQAVIDHRKKLKKPLTAHAAKLLAGKFSQTPNPNAAADAMIANGWQGFEPEWLSNRTTGHAKGSDGHANGNGHHHESDADIKSRHWKMLERERELGKWTWATPKSEIPRATIEEFDRQQRRLV